jgi:hypothetical protein
MVTVRVKTVPVPPPIGTMYEVIAAGVKESSLVPTDPAGNFTASSPPVALTTSSAAVGVLVPMPTFETFAAAVSDCVFGL